MLHVRKIVLTMKEHFNDEEIKRYVDQGGNFKRICLKLGISERTGRRMVAGYKKLGKAYFVHGNRGRSPATKISKEHRDCILALYQSHQYKGANFKHFHELLERLHPELPLFSLSTLRNIFKEAQILSPKATRATQKAFKKKRRELEKHLEIQTTEGALTPELSLDPNPHPRREKAKYSGELLFMDASQHDWFESGTKHHLHAVIDDHTGAVLGAYMADQETLQGYYKVVEQVLKNYGIPFGIQTDGRSIFEYAAFSKPLLEKETYTQFSYACKTLGIHLKTTSSAQAQGKIERLFGTWQSRLVVELRVHGIKTKQEANEFLPSYLPEYNKQFATSHPHDTLNVFETKPSDEEINLILAVIHQRVIDQGNCIRYENKYYKLLNQEAQQQFLRPKSKVTVIKALDEKLYATQGESVFALEILDLYKKYSWNFDEAKEQTQPRQLVIPPMSHPWKQGSFEKHQRRLWESLYRLDWDHLYSYEDVWHTTERLFG